MSKTQIEWTQRPGTIGETWNPTTGCNKVDRGCKHCYAEIMHNRLQAMGQEKYKADFLQGAKCHEDTLDIPLTWKKPRTVFVNSMSDLFHADVPLDFINKVFTVMRATPQHTYLILTKRPERLVDFELVYHVGTWTWPSNVWMGTSVNDQKSAVTRIPYLLKIPAALRFISYEPATGPVDLTRWLGSYWRLPVKHTAPNVRLEELVSESFFVNGIDWVICGGESGPKAQPMHPDWARKVRDDCRLFGVPFFFKQWGQWQPITYYNGHAPIIDYAPGKSGFLFNDPYRLQNMVRSRKKDHHELDGETWQQFPEIVTLTT